MIVDVDGHGAHAATGGGAHRGGDPIVLLVHGAGMDATVWQHQTRYLAHHGFRPLAVDLPGHGRSEGAPLTTIGDMADWLARFIEAATGVAGGGDTGGAGGAAVAAGGEAQVAVVGHSMGSFVGIELAAHRSELVRSLVLLGTAAAMPVHPDLLTAADDDLPSAAALMAAWGHAKPAHIGLNPTPGLWMLGGARALVEMSPAGALAADFRACAAYDGATTAAAGVRCPVAVAVGMGDKMTPPRASAELVAALDNPRVIELDDTGHMMMVESPSAVRRLLIEVLTPA